MGKTSNAFGRTTSSPAGSRGQGTETRTYLSRVAGLVQRLICYHATVSERARWPGQPHAANEAWTSGTRCAPSGRARPNGQYSATASSRPAGRSTPSGQERPVDNTLSCPARFASIRLQAPFLFLRTPARESMPKPNRTSADGSGTSAAAGSLNWKRPVRAGALGLSECYSNVASKVRICCRSGEKVTSVMVKLPKT
jgi:hypothetical protein